MNTEMLSLLLIFVVVLNGLQCTHNHSKYITMAHKLKVTCTHIHKHVFVCIDDAEINKKLLFSFLINTRVGTLHVTGFSEQ